MMKFITFYSYKGGVGRTMCLANIAVMLAKWGHKVLMVDWDWEAPGLERYFVSENFNGKTQDTHVGLDLQIVKEKPGLIDLLTERKKESWKEAIITIAIPDAREPLHLISAGRRDDDYFKRVREFNVDTFYAKKKGGQYIEDLRTAWRDEYDFVLIDSRTGVTEVNGIATIQMPNLVVLLFTSNNQSFEGILDIAHRSNAAQQKLPYDRTKLLFLPILSRLESTTELELTNDWVNHFATDGLMDIYKYWLPTLNTRVRPEEFLMMTKIPHVPYYTFGEKLAVIKDGTSNPTSMGYAYEGIASLIANRLEHVEEFVERREEFVKLSETDGEANRPSVYISYSHADRETGEKIIDYLHKNNLRVVIDFNNMVAGESIEDFIERAQESQYYILIISQHSLKSGWINYDVNRFFKKGRLSSFIPVRVDTTLFDDDYVIEALNSTHQKIEDLAQKSQQIKKLGANSDYYLQGSIARLKAVTAELPTLIESLRSLLVLDISTNNFEINMAKVVKRINS